MRRHCPKCGSCVFLAEHKNRFSCGNCGYTEFKSGGKSQQPSQPKPEVKTEEKPVPSTPEEKTDVPADKPVEDKEIEPPVDDKNDDPTSPVEEQVEQPSEPENRSGHYRKG